MMPYQGPRPMPQQSADQVRKKQMISQQVNMPAQGAPQLPGIKPGQSGYSAQPYVQQAMNYSNSAMQPYSQYSNQGPDLEQKYSEMANDPVQSYENIRSQYQQTPGHKQALEDSLRMAENAATAAGMSGTPLDQRNQMEAAAGVNDRYQREWVRDIMNREQTGLNGKQGLYNTSYNANTYDTNNQIRGMDKMGNFAENQNISGINAKRDYLSSAIESAPGFLDGIFGEAGSKVASEGGSAAGTAIGGSLGGPIGAALGGVVGRYGGQYLNSLFGPKSPAPAAPANQEIAQADQNRGAVNNTANTENSSDFSASADPVAVEAVQASFPGMPEEQSNAAAKIYSNLWGLYHGSVFVPSYL